MSSRVRVILTADKSGFDTAIKGVRSNLQGLKGMVAGAFTVGAVTSIISKTMDYADTIDKASLRMKITTEETQALGIVAREAGSSLETVETAFKKIEMARSKALGGNAKALAAFKVLGIDTGELSKPSNKIGMAAKLASAGAHGSTGTEGVALQSLGLKGASGDLIAIGDSLQNFGAKVAELKGRGAIMEDKDIANMIQAKDEMAVMGNMLMATIAPWISQALEGFQEGLVIVNAYLKNLFLLWINMFDIVKKKIGDIIEFVKHPIKGTKDAIVAAAKGASKVVDNYNKGGIKGVVSGAVSDFANSDIGKALETSGTGFIKDMDKGFMDINKQKTSLMAQRAAARQSNKPEGDSAVIPVKEKGSKGMKVYSDSLTQSGNMFGASFRNIGNVTSALDVAKNQLSEAQKQTELLKTVATNTEDTGNNNGDSGDYE